MRTTIRSTTSLRRLAALACAAMITASAAAQTDAVSDPPSPFQVGVQQLQNGNLVAAEASLKKAVEANPDNPQAVFFYGFVLHGLGRLDEALVYHRKAAEFDSVRSTATYNEACALALLERTDEAYDALASAVDAGFADRDGARQDSDLASLRVNAKRWSETMASIDLADRSPWKAMAFWVGEWDCYAPSGSQSGSNSLTSEANGLFIHERWSNANGGGGQSFNYYDPEAKVWRQVWTDPTRTLQMEATPTKRGELLFVGTQMNRQGQKLHRKMLVRALDHGVIYQAGRGSSDGETWNDLWALYYVPKGVAFDADKAPEPGDWPTETEEDAG